MVSITPYGHCTPGIALFEKIVRRCRCRLLRLHFESAVGHIGGNLSVLPALLGLFHRTMTANDSFILSKGHSAGALYIALWSAGRLSEKELLTFCGEGTLLGAHPKADWHPDILFPTGALGHGPSLAAGLALGKKLRGEAGHVYCLTSDGEWQEGSCWEALIFLVHHQLNNLTLVIDDNKLQAFGYTKDVSGIADLACCLSAFGIDCQEVSGRDYSALVRCLGQASDRPRAVLVHNVKGDGVPFMENKMEWHYLSLDEDRLAAAIEELKTLCPLSDAMKADCPKICRLEVDDAS